MEDKLILNEFDAVIFDMDGVLIDSEPLWKIAMDKVFNSLGSNLTKGDFEKTVGLRIDEVIHFWNIHEKWNLKDEKIVENRIIDELIDLINNHGKPLDGVLEVLEYLQKFDKKIGLATSSSFRLIDTVLLKLNIKKYFNVTQSAEYEDFGKPHPAVYIRTAELLNVDSTKCLVIEDSFNGVVAGLAARMKVVCIPEKTHQVNNRLNIANFKFESLNEFLAEIKKEPLNHK